MNVPTAEAITDCNRRASKAPQETTTIPLPMEDGSIQALDMHNTLERCLLVAWIKTGPVSLPVCYYQPADAATSVTHMVLGACKG